MNVECVGKMSRIKGFRQACRQEPEKVLGGSERVRFVDLQEFLVLDLEIVFPPPPPSAVPIW